MRGRHGGLSEPLRERRQDGHKALRLLHHRHLLLAFRTHETTVAAAGVAPLVARAQAGPGRHPRLHVGRPAHHTALLLQEHALAVHLLDDTTNADVDPHADVGEDGAAEELPRPERGHDVLGLLGRHRRGLGALGGLHLLLQARLPRLQLLRGRHQVDAVLEGLGQPPLLRPPRLPNRLRQLFVRLGWAGQVVEADGPSHVDCVTDPGQGVDDRHPARAGTDHAVVEGHAHHSDHWRPGHDLLHREVVGAIQVVGDDVAAEDGAVGGAEDKGAGPSGPHCAQLTKGVALGVETGGREPVGHEEEHANPGVDVVAPPLLLKSAVKLKVLGRGAARGRRAALACMEITHLIALVPPGHLALLHRTLGLFGGIAVGTFLNVLLGCWSNKWDAEHIGRPSPFKGVSGLPRLVKLFRRGDGQTHMAGEHVGSARLCACRGVHGQPVVQHEEHERRARIRPVEAEEPTGRRGAVHTKPARHDELEVEHEEDHAHNMVKVLLRACERGHVADVLTVHGRLLDGKRVPGGVPSEAQLIVEHVVCPIVREGRGTRSTCSSCCSRGRFRIGRRGAQDAR
mmetsp:Transcript_17594/g.56339  ORF Transcript_17594/g.56339 Transcript_17594/m.56339 type:complete len:569 (-) Transcript_17594:86-1792(-)